jgi:hypothetical protein
LNLGKMYSIFLILFSLSISGWCGKIIYPLNAAAFSVNGNHDHYELADGGDTNNKFESWNSYHGLRTFHFKYASTRFMALSDAFGEDYDAQTAYARFRGFITWRSR